MPEAARSSYDALVDTTYDHRIPIMVAAYFRDMERVLQSMRANARPGASLVFDIGDSRYSGVTIPVHTIIAMIGSQLGWELTSEEQLRARRSFDGTPLKQVILNFVAH
ncbi:hypothetical protein DEJ01_12625 [Curtobacterium sp. MCLR17_040]|nr:hypothetical protein DEJ01_12625 [Curtobacterium sp. MCLR17_040]